MGDGVTQEDLDEAVNQILNGVTTVSSVLHERLVSAEATIDSLEKQLAALIVSFGEVSAIADALAGHVIRSADEADINEFQKDVQKLKATMMETLRGNVQRMGEENPDFAEAMAGLVGKLSTDTE